MPNRMKKLGFFKKIKLSLKLIPDFIEIGSLLPYIKIVANVEVAALKSRLDVLREKDTNVMRFVLSVEKVIERLDEIF